MAYFYTQGDMPVYGRPRPGRSIPILVVSEAVGTKLAALVTDNAPASAAVTVALSVVAVYSDVITRNLIVDTFAGDADNVVVVGSHSDSVPAGALFG